jgi:pyrimidine operon attenuation protein/uracil phosphoribosyltransferase
VIYAAKAPTSVDRAAVERVRADSKTGAETVERKTETVGRKPVPERAATGESALQASLEQAPTGADRQGRTVLSAEDVARIIDRIAHQILERSGGGRDTVLMGIRTRGATLSGRLARRCAVFAGHELPVGTLDVTPYRDDLDLRVAHSTGPTVLPECGVSGRRVILIDDVLFSGRTVRAALDAIADLGRPRLVELAVLVDRGHRELPIRADYVGKNLPTGRQETVRVSFTETDGRDGVILQSTVD